jgi:predicted transcriptional regulator
MEKDGNASIKDMLRAAIALRCEQGLAHCFRYQQQPAWMSFSFANVLMLTCSGVKKCERRDCETRRRNSAIDRFAHR